jgi:hypothetical protein
MEKSPPGRPVVSLMIRGDRHRRMTHPLAGFSMPRDNQPPNRTAYHLASQVVRVCETEDRRTRTTLRVLYYDGRIQTALWTIISLSSRSLKPCSGVFAMQMEESSIRSISLAISG